MRRTTGRPDEIAPLEALDSLPDAKGRSWRVLAGNRRHSWLTVKVALIGEGVGRSNHWLLYKDGALSVTDKYRLFEATLPELVPALLASLEREAEPWDYYLIGSWEVSVLSDPIGWDRVRLRADGFPTTILHWSGTGFRDTDEYRRFNNQRLMPALIGLLEKNYN